MFIRFNNYQMKMQFEMHGLAFYTFCHFGILYNFCPRVLDKFDPYCFLLKYSNKSNKIYLSKFEIHTLCSANQLECKTNNIQFQQGVPDKINIW